MLTMRTGDTDEASALGVASLVWWHWAILGLLVAALLAALIWVIVGWRRKHKAAAPPASAGTSVASRLSRLWVPFYRWIPARALHYPTVVVMGSAGVGKTHAITCHVDWRGQANQFRSSVDHDAALQLYLGPDIIVHELSGPLLRDVSRRARRALRRLWRRMGPSATVVFVVDARTLLTTPPAALRELAQLVRGKISLFPRRCRTSLAVRVLLSHVDQVDGYETFAAAVGSEHPALELERLGPDLSDAEGLIAAFDMHLAYALTTRSGEEFDRMVRFYGALRELLTGLRPLLVTLQGRDEPHAEPLGTDGLYLGSLAPRSHVGKPFLVTRDVISASIGRQHQRGLRAASAVAVSGSALVAALMSWHLTRIQEADAQFKEFKRQLPNIDDVDDCANAQFSPSQTDAADAAAAAVRAVTDSEYLWLAHTFEDRKRNILENFEEAIRTTYLYPQIPCSDRRRLLFLMSLIYSSHGNRLGAIIMKHSAMWARELGLSQWVIENYVTASSSDMTGVNPSEPDEKESKWRTGREWSIYIDNLHQNMVKPTISKEEAKYLTEGLVTLPVCSPAESEVLTEVRQVLAQEDTLRGRFRDKLVVDSIDLWTEAECETLKALKVTLEEHMKLLHGRAEGWGLDTLVTALANRPPDISRKFDITFGGKRVILDGVELAVFLKRSNSRMLLEQVLEDVSKVGRGDGLAFFDESEVPAEVGAILGVQLETIPGYYTKRAFERRVAPVLRFAAEVLAPVLDVAAEGATSATPEPETEKGGLVSHGLTETDARRLDEAIRAATAAYAAAYRQKLSDYYWSLDLPASELMLPVVLKAFSRPSSWFIDYLRVVTTNATLDLSPDDPYVAPLAEALATFGPLLELLSEKDGGMPGLEAYHALLAKLHVASMGTAKSRDGAELRHRLTPLGALALDALLTPATDPVRQVEGWLTEAGIGEEWHAPFLAPVQAARVVGIDNIEVEVARAWGEGVRPLLRPLLEAYPFDPDAHSNVDIEEFEALVRAQGGDPGAFWVAFTRLIAPSTVRVAGDLEMLDELTAPPGMLAMLQDLERTSRTLWDADGNRIPLKVTLIPQELQEEPHEGRLASMSYLRAGNAAVYGFNQRPEPQMLELQWWNQGISIVSLEMRRGVKGADPRKYTIEADGSFSFYRLLDRGENAQAASHRLTLTAAAIARATRCTVGKIRGPKAVSVIWRVPVGDETSAIRRVRMDLTSNPWLPFSVRQCD